MIISDIPCIDFFAKKQDPLAYEKSFWIHCIHACREAGYTLEDIGNKIEDITYVYCLGQEECSAYKQALSEYPDADGKLPCCREYAKEIGIDMDKPFSDLCLVCPLSEQSSINTAQEYAILSKLFQLPDKGGLSYMNGQLSFHSFVDMDSGNLFSGMVKEPLVMPLAALFYECLCADPQKYYDGICEAISSDKKGALNQSAAVDSLAEALGNKVMDALGDRSKSVFGEEMSNGQIKAVLSGYICSEILSCVPAGDDVFSFFISCCMDEDEMDEEETENEPAMQEQTEEEIGKIDEEQDFSSEDVSMPPASEESTTDAVTPKIHKDKEAQVNEPAEGVATIENVPPAADLKKECKELEEKKIASYEDEAPVRTLENYTLFDKKVSRTRGTWFGKKDTLMLLPYQSRRYKIPFAQNDQSVLSATRNMIVHHEMNSAALSKMVDISARSSLPEDKRRMEMDFLSDKVRKDFSVAVEIAYVTDLEMYAMVIWNAGSRKFDYVPLIYKKDGILQAIPYQVIQFLKSEKRQIVCYQPYLLCGICSLYDRMVEIKTVYSLYSQYQVIVRRSVDGEQGRGSYLMEDVFETYNYAMDKEELYQRDLYQDKYGSDAYFLSMMPLYQRIAEKQKSLAEALGITGLCVSQTHKDLMYGYSYLSCGIYPSRQQAAFSLYPGGHIAFLHKVEPAISYVPGYIMQYSFVNNDAAADETTTQIAVEHNRKARKLLLKELAKLQAAFYHNDLKILYMDDYHIVFFVTHKYRSVHATDIGQILMHETYRYKVQSNKMRAVFWGTSLTDIRYIHQH